MMNAEFAQHFATDWLAAWNRHDLATILAHYADDFEMRSPYIVQIAGEPSGVLRGKAAVGAYWAAALARIPDLRFTLIDTFIGVDSLIIHYQGARGPAAEVFEFGADGQALSSAPPPITRPEPQEAS